MNLLAGNSPEATLADAMEIVCAKGWFSERSPEVQRMLASVARLKSFKADEAIYLVGDEPNGVFGLVNGSVDISIPRADGTDFTVHQAERGFWIGDLALMSSASRLVSVRAATDVLAIHLRSKDVLALIKEQPTLLFDFYALTYANLATALFLLSNIAIASSEARVALRLLLYIEHSPHPEGRIRVSQAKLGEMVALSQPTLQRVLRRLQDLDCIERGYNEIRVTNRAKLLELCGEDVDLPLSISAIMQQSAG